MRILLLPIFWGFLNLAAQNPVKMITPIRYKENIQLAEYTVDQTYSFSKNELFIIAKKGFEKGFQLLYLKKESTSEHFLVKFISQGKGEAYVYYPYFYQFGEKQFIIIVEEGYEYMSGIDIFILQEGQIKFIGYVPVSGDERDSVIPKLSIKKQEDHFEILFSGKIEYKIATDRLINGSQLKVRFGWNIFEIIEK